MDFDLQYKDIVVVDTYILVLYCKPVEEELSPFNSLGSEFSSQGHFHTL